MVHRVLRVKIVFTPLEVPNEKQEMVEMVSRENHSRGLLAGELASPLKYGLRQLMPSLCPAPSPHSSPPCACEEQGLLRPSSEHPDKNTYHRAALPPSRCCTSARIPSRLSKQPSYRLPISAALTHSTAAGNSTYPLSPSNLSR